jgi:hypothetical protein
MKKLILIFVVSLSLFGEVRIEGFKQFKLGMTLNELKALDVVRNVDYFNPLCMVSTKSEQTLTGVNVGKFIIMLFQKGRIKSISIHNIDITNFSKIKNTLEKKFNEQFIYIKSKNLKKICSYYSLKTKKEEIRLYKGCGEKSKNTMSIDIIDHLNVYKNDKNINLDVNDF